MWTKWTKLKIYIINPQICVCVCPPSYLRNPLTYDREKLHAYCTHHMKDFYEKFFWKIEKKNFEKIFTIFFSLKMFGFRFFPPTIFFLEIFFRFFVLFCAVGERSELWGV